MATRRFGYRGLIRDHRDRLRSAPPAHLAATLPAVVSLVDREPPIWDQDGLSSCVIHGVGAAWCMESGNLDTPARLALYWGVLDIEGLAGQDVGTYPRDAFKLMSRMVPPESVYPYLSSLLAQRPSDAVWAAGLGHCFASYHQVAGVDGVRQELAEGHPVAIGWSVPKTFTEDTTVLDEPRGDVGYQGGHCTLIAGYDHIRQTFDVRNSWGRVHDGTGHFKMTYAAFDLLVSEGWAGRV
jgi:hypothetical protein